MEDATSAGAAWVPPKRFPDFFIVGHPKCGTTALYETLKQHPQIYMPDAKEPNFFSGERQTSDGPAETLDDYLSLFRAAEPGERIGEASVFYLASGNAASSIAHAHPAAKIIAILREPAQFLYSLHLQFVQSDFETEKDLRKALSLEDARSQGRHIPRSASHWQQRLLYSRHVRYVEQLRRFHCLFPPEQILVLIYDDFRRENKSILRAVLHFLDVDDMVPIDVPEANPTVHVRSRLLNRIVFRQEGLVWQALAGAAKVLAPRQLRRYLWQSRHRLIYGPPPQPDMELMLELRRRFKPEVVALSEFLNRDLVALWGYDGID